MASAIPARRIGYLWQVCLLAGAYVIAARISLTSAIPPGYASAVWPPSGIALGSMLLFGSRIWPGIWIGAAVANLSVESSLFAAAIIASGNTLEAIVGAALIRRHLGVLRCFERSEDVVKFVVLCAVGPVIAATAALAPLAFSHALSWPEILRNWWTWWQGDVTGIIIITPLMLSWSAPGAKAWPPERKLEGLCFAVLLLAASAMVAGEGAGDFAPLTLTFMALPFIIWASFRFGQREVTLAIAVVCTIAVWYTVKRQAAIGAAPLNELLLTLLTFISTVVTTGLVLVAAVAERGHAAARLRKERDELDGRVQTRTRELNEANRVLHQDIEQRKRTERLLRDSEERYRAIVDSVSDYAIFGLDAEGNVTTWNVGAERIKGYGAKEIVGEHFSKFYPRDEVERGTPQRELRMAETDGRFEAEGWRVRKDGSAFWANVVITALKDETGSLCGFGKVTRDLTRRKGPDEQLAYLADYDPLTGLPNRHMLGNRLNEALSEGASSPGLLGCMFVNLDRFKAVNDTYGHKVGDTLLNQLSVRLKRCAGNADVIGRLGGDEFLVVLPKLKTAEEPAAVAQKMIDAMATPFIIQGREIYASASIGIAVYPEDGDKVEVLIQNADAAMSRAKELGRGTYQFYQPGMQERGAHRLEIETQLRGALERNEFVLHYQPKVELAEGAIRGFEALLRWKHPDRGLVQPAEFISILEDTGLIVPVGEWVLQSVCEQIKRWTVQGITARPISVNVSARQFQQKNFDASVASIIRKAGIDAALLQLELTESLLMKDASESRRTLTSLKASGVRLSMDDFGTGYSSLAYLKLFPLDELKIDRQFIRDATEDPNDAAIAQAIITLGHSLKLRVVAEGVETQSQVAFLRSQGCDEIQGHYFARPMSVEDCTAALLEDRRMGS